MQLFPFPWPRSPFPFFVFPKSFLNIFQMEPHNLSIVHDLQSFIIQVVQVCLPKVTSIFLVQSLISISQTRVRNCDFVSFLRFPLPDPWGGKHFINYCPASVPPLPGRPDLFIASDVSLSLSSTVSKSLNLRREFQIVTLSVFSISNTGPMIRGPFHKWLPHFCSSIQKCGNQKSSNTYHNK